MRDLKFRAFIDDEMVYLPFAGLQYFDFEGSYAMSFAVDGYNAFWAHECYERIGKEMCANAPIMQYTGLKDKNGIEIYEGDIYEFEGWHGSIEHAMYEESLAKEGRPAPNYMERRVVLGHPNGHFISRKLDDTSDMTYVGDTFEHSPSLAATWEVIGNIYETPELLNSTTAFLISVLLYLFFCGKVDQYERKKSKSRNVNPSKKFLKKCI